MLPPFGRKFPRRLLCHPDWKREGLGTQDTVQRTRPLEFVARRNQSQWVFPAPTKSGHIDPSSIRKQHAKAIKDSKVPKFVIYSIRHTAITRWSKKVDAYTL